MSYSAYPSETDPPRRPPNRLAQASRLIAAAQITVRRIGDSQMLSGQNLSADTEKGISLQVIEIARKNIFASQELLAREAGTTDRTYRRMLAEPEGVAPSMINRLADALRRIRSGQTLDDARTTALIESTYGGFVATLAPRLGVTADQVRAATPQRGATADTLWRNCAHVRQAAIYLTNTAVAVSQRSIARTVGLTEAAVCLAIQSVEDRRSDVTFDRLLDQVAKDVTGRML